MNCFVLFSLFVLATVTYALPRPDGPGGPGGPVPTPEASECLQALVPTEEEFAEMENAAQKCLGQESVQETLSGLPLEGSNQDLGNSKMASDLRKCIAQELGLNKEDGTFDMDAFKASITAKVTGQSVQSNTQLGLDNCPAVLDYDVASYMGCILSYCETGAAPIYE